MTIRYGDIKDDFGSGGSNMAPSGVDGTPVVRDILRTALSTSSAPFADQTAMEAGLAADRVDGMSALKLDDYSPWTWQAADTTAADATHIKPTDVGSGAGRWVAEGAALETAAAASVTTRISTSESTTSAASASLTTRISTSESTTSAASASLTTRVSTEESTRSTAAASLTTRVSTEESVRAASITSALTSLNARLTAIESTEALVG